LLRCDYVLQTQSLICKSCDKINSVPFIALDFVRLHEM
jgi:hypothetical protein